MRCWETALSLRQMTLGSSTPHHNIESPGEPKRCIGCLAPSAYRSKCTTRANPSHHLTFPPSMVLLRVPLGVVLLREEKVLKRTIRGKGHRSDAQPRQGALVAVPPAEDARVAPGLAVTVSAGVERGGRGEEGGTHARSQGSFFGTPVDALRARMSKPVMLGLGRYARSALPKSASVVPWFCEADRLGTLSRTCCRRAPRCNWW